MIGEPIFEHKEQFADCLEQLQQTAITVKDTCAEQAIRYLLLPQASVILSHALDTHALLAPCLYTVCLSATIIWHLSPSAQQDLQDLLP